MNHSRSTDCGAIIPSADTPVTSQPFYIPSLDGIRAIAVLLVFAGHAGLDKFVPAGFGVTVFFFLSGYLITTLLRRELEKTGQVSIKNFYLRRVVRIFPPMYLYLFFAIALHLIGVFSPPIDTIQILIQCFFMANYQQIFTTVYELQPLTPSGSRILWSLAVEEHFYLFFPLFFAFLRRRFSGRTFANMLLGLCLGVLIWRCVLVLGFRVPIVRTYVATDTRVDSILFGCILAVWGNPILDQPMLKRFSTKCLCLIASIGILFVAFAFRHPHFRETFRYSLQGLALMPIFYLAISEHEWAIFRCLNWRWMKLIGVLSYSMYLFHFSMIYVSLIVFGKEEKTFATGVVALTLTLSVSYLIFRFVETPLASLRRKLH